MTTGDVVGAIFLLVLIAVLMFIAIFAFAEILCRPTSSKHPTRWTPDHDDEERR